MDGRAVWLIARKELQGLYNEKTIILAITLQLFIALFSSFLVVGLTSMYDPASVSRYSRSSYGIGYVGDDTSLVAYLEEEGNFRVYRMDLSEAVAALRERQLAGVVYIPSTLPESGDPVILTLYLIQNDLQSSMIGSRLKLALSRYEQDLRELRSDRLELQPLTLEFPSGPVGGDFFEFIYTILVPLLLFLPVIISAALIIDFITEEYQLGTLETLLSTPASFSEIIYGKILAAEILVPLQAGTWLLLLHINGVHVSGSLEILLFVSVAALCLILISALIALHYRERTNAQTIFSLGFVILIMAVLALPANPINMVVRIATATAGIEKWLVFGFLCLGTFVLAWITSMYTKHVERRSAHHEG
jgi:ABC-2 type transport system permease protein